jgi:hypothetical protein
MNLEPQETKVLMTIQRWKRLLRTILRYVLYLMGSYFVFVVYAIVLLNLDFATFFNTDDDATLSRNMDALVTMFFTTPVVGVLLATKTKVTRFAALLILVVFWIYPVVHWYWIGAPAHYRDILKWQNP